MWPVNVEGEGGRGPHAPDAAVATAADGDEVDEVRRHLPLQLPREGPSGRVVWCVCVRGKPTWEELRS